MNPPQLTKAFSRFSNQVLNRLPQVPTDARRWMEMATTPQRAAWEMHDAWLNSVGGVSKSRYLEVLEENLRLRRRLEELEAQLTGRSDGEAPAAAAGAAMDEAFSTMKKAQDQWMSMWLPGSSGKATPGEIGDSSAATGRSASLESTPGKNEPQT